MSGQSDLTLDEVVEMYFRVFGAMQQLNVTDWMELDLSTAQLKVLFMVNFRGPLPISQIAHLVGIGAPTASHLVEKLVQAGLLERIELTADRRIVHAQVTAKGHAIALRLRQGRADILQRWVKQLPAADRAALRQGLYALLQIAANDLNYEIETASEAIGKESNQ